MSSSPGTGPLGLASGPVQAGGVFWGVSLLRHRDEVRATETRQGRGLTDPTADVASAPPTIGKFRSLVLFCCGSVQTCNAAVLSPVTVPSVSI